MKHIQGAMSATSLTEGCNLIRNMVSAGRAYLDLKIGAFFIRMVSIVKPRTFVVGKFRFVLGVSRVGNRGTISASLTNNFRTQRTNSCTKDQAEFSFVSEGKLDERYCTPGVLREVATSARGDTMKIRSFIVGS